MTSRRCRSVARCCAYLLVVSVIGCAGRTVPAPSAANYLRISREADGELGRELSLWFPRCVDGRNGGFHQGFDRSWRIGDDWPRFVVFQARMTWVAAAYRHYSPEDSAEYDGYISHGLRFLAGKQWDRARGGYLDNVMPDGSACENGEQTTKSTYGTAFALYATARAYETEHTLAARELLTKTLSWLEQHAHDPAHGGFYNALTRDGRHAPEGFITTYDETKRPGWKTMNTHIHLLEAYTEAYRAMPSPSLRSRLRELLLIVRDRIATPAGYLRQYFNDDWSSIPADDSYGHDIETAYLIVEASTALGEANDPATWARARSLVDHSLSCAYADDGGIATSGTPNGENRNMERSWWAQAESLNALLLMHERYGAETDRYWRAFVRQWGFIRSRMIDREYGGWYDKVDGNGDPTADEKGNAWKEAYHNSRALMNVAGRLRRLARR